MSNKIGSVRGTKDLYGSEIRKFNHVINTAKSIATVYGFEEFQTPIIEFSQVFKKTLGEDSDVVGKEMYSFSDRSGEEITLRPEFTAGIVRAFISNGLKQNLPLRLFSYGPLFRYERPQKGRQRQFHQINFEVLGLESPMYDAEVILLANQLLTYLGVNEDVTLNINSLANKHDRQKYREALVTYFNKYKNDLSEDSQKRLITNPLRILDSKDETDRKISEDAPNLVNYYSSESAGYFASLLDLLSESGIKYKVNPRLVRGLDYYDHTIFEFITDKLGAQGTVLGGGRYNGLVEMMGGEAVKSIGFAAGVERLEGLISLHEPDYQQVVTMIKAGKVSDSVMLSLANMLRNENISTVIAHHDDVGKQFKYASKIKSCLCIIIGETELQNKTVKIKHMQSGIQEEVSLDNFIEYTAKAVSEYI